MKPKAIFGFGILLIIFISGCSFIDDVVLKKPKSKAAIGMAGAELTVEQRICQKTKCIKVAYEAKTTNLISFVLIGNSEIKNYLEENHIASSDISNIIDYVEVFKNPNGQLQQINLLIPSNETDPTKATANLCSGIISRGIECEIKIMPVESDKNLKEWVNAGCLFAFGNVVPDPIDAACIIVNLAQG